MVLSVGAPDGGAVVSAVEQQPRGRERAGHASPVAANSFTGALHDRDVAVAASTTVMITAAYNGTTRTATLTVTPPAPEPPPASLQSVVAEPVERHRRIERAGHRHPVGRGAAGRRRRVALEQQPASPPCRRASRSLPGATHARPSPSRRRRVSASTRGDDLGDLNGTTRTAQPHRDAARAAAADRDADVTATGRSGERVTSSPAGINVATGSSGSASFAVRHGDHAERLERPRRDLVRRLLERRQQEEDVHVHATARPRSPPTCNKRLVGCNRGCLSAPSASASPWRRGDETEP